VFTGIITALGIIEAISRRAEDAQVTIHAPGYLDDIHIGDSIAVNGCCLTVVRKTADSFDVVISAETLRCTNLSTLENGIPVNLEKAVTLQQLLSGHLVTGHVDTVVEIVEQAEEGQSICYWIQCPEAFMKYIAPKGAVCLDGVSLTVNAVLGNRFSINIIPHTQQKTLFKWLKKGDHLNMEVDILARYVERLLVVNKTEVPHA